MWQYNWKSYKLVWGSRIWKSTSARSLGLVPVKLSTLFHTLKYPNKNQKPKFLVCKNWENYLTDWNWSRILPQESSYYIIVTCKTVCFITNTDKALKVFIIYIRLQPWKACYAVQSIIDTVNRLLDTCALGKEMINESTWYPIWVLCRFIWSTYSWSACNLIHLLSSRMSIVKEGTGTSFCGWTESSQQPLMLRLTFRIGKRHKKFQACRKTRSLWITRQSIQSLSL